MLIGVGFACQQIDVDDAASLRMEDWDVPLDAIVNEREFLPCPR
jgi:5-formyltetrahydrofolate cyclo-ligase